MSHSKLPTWAVRCASARRDSLSASRPAAVRLVHGVEGGADAADHRAVRAVQRIDEDRVPASPELVVERLPLARQRHQVVRDARIGGVPRSEEVVDAGADDVAGAQAGDVDEPARRVRESQLAIDRPHGPRMLAEHQAQRAVAFAPIARSHPAASRSSPASSTASATYRATACGRDEIRLRVRRPALPRRQRDDADDADPGPRAARASPSAGRSTSSRGGSPRPSRGRRTPPP